MEKHKITDEERFEMWFRGRKEGNRIKTLLCSAVSIAVMSPKKSGRVLLLMILVSDNREQP